jgi:hypothetical protein
MIFVLEDLPETVLNGERLVRVAKETEAKDTRRQATHRRSRLIDLNLFHFHLVRVGARDLWQEVCLGP